MGKVQPASNWRLIVVRDLAGIFLTCPIQCDMQDMTGGWFRPNFPPIRRTRCRATFSRKSISINCVSSAQDAYGYQTPEFGCRRMKKSEAIRRTQDPLILMTCGPF